MALGRRHASHSGELFLTSADLPRSPGHAFYDRLNELLAEADFDRFVEDLCQPHYAHEIGRPSLPPGTYFRMLFVGYFEGIDSQRGIAWRCADSFSLRAFLGIPATDASPDHSSLTRIRQRLPEVVHERVFARVLALAHEKDLLKGQTIGVDSTTREANAAMRAIVRKDTGEDYQAYLRRLAKDAGMDNPTDEELIRFDRKRKGKTTPNTDWESATDGASRIAKMKDGRTHLAYKAEHAVDLDSGLVFAAGIHSADTGDTATLVDSVLRTQVNLERADVGIEVEEVVADKGYHKAKVLAECAELGWRTSIPEPERKTRRWTDKPDAWRVATAANRRRVKGERGKRLQAKRSEMVERSFAHVCDTGGSRRTWLRGRVNVSKRYLIVVAAHNLGVVMRSLFGVGKPRVLQGADGGVFPPGVWLWVVRGGWLGRLCVRGTSDAVAAAIGATASDHARNIGFFNGLIGPG